MEDGRQHAVVLGHVQDVHAFGFGDLGTGIGEHVELAAAGATAPALDRARARRRVRIGDLGAALAEAWEADPALPVAATTSGAVALARALAAPLPIRAVVRGRTLHAVDAGWEFGSGPEIAGTARDLVLFLYGRGPVPSAAST